MARITKVRVTVTFLRMNRPPATAARPLPEDLSVLAMTAPPVAFYRYLYDTVGADYLWWLRRVMPDNDLARLLRNPAVSLHVLYSQGSPAGFFELDRSLRPDINLSYFGLFPHMIGRGVGRSFLRCAIDEAWRSGASGITVNTCTADHPRALPNYLTSGFEFVRQAEEVWAIPDHLGMKIPPELRA